MKYAKTLMLVLAFIFVAVIGSNCAKESSPTASGEETYLGTWRWVHTYGGIGGWTDTPESVGYSQTLILAGSRVYQMYRDDLLWRNGLYWVSWEKQGSPTDSICVIRYENKRDGQLISWHADTLKLLDMYDDGFQHTYVRTR